MKQFLLNLCALPTMSNIYLDIAWRDLKRSCHQTNSSYGGFVRKVPFYYFLFFFFIVIFSIPVFYVRLSFFQGVPWAAGWPLDNTVAMRCGARFSTCRKLVYVLLYKVSTFTVETLIYWVIVQVLRPKMTKWKCVLTPTLKQRHVNAACILVAWLNCRLA